MALQVGFTSLAIMGSRMAANLRAHGFDMRPGSIWVNSSTVKNSSS